MKKMLYIVCISLVGLIASCGNGKKQMAEAEDNRYGIH